MNITLTNTGSTDLALNLKFTEDRVLARRIPALSSVDIGDLATVEELEANDTFAALRTAGTITMSFSDSNNIYPLEILRVAFAAGAGAADDVTVVASAPYPFEIIDAQMVVSTAEAAETLTLRTATGGAGTALSSALSLTNLGRVRDALAAALPSVAEGGAVYARRSASTNAGELLISIRRTG